MSEQRQVLVSGASGLIGRRLLQTLEAAGHEVARLVRRDPIEPGEYRWDPYGGFTDPQAFVGIDAVVHLSGAGIGNRRWTTRRKQEIYDSRVVTTRVLAEHLAALDDRPEVLIAQSAIGIYGDRGDEILTERSAVGPDGDFLTDLTIDWEEAAASAEESGIRVVHSRTGLVLDRSAPLMQRLVPLFKAGLGGPIGDGSQWWSWIALDDVVAVIDHLIGSPISGPVNVVAPEPVRQAEFARTLAEVLHRPSFLPAPKLGVQLALGAEKATAIAFSSARVIPERLDADEFEYGGPELEAALRRMLT